MLSPYLLTHLHKTWIMYPSTLTRCLLFITIWKLTTDSFTWRCLSIRINFLRFCQYLFIVPSGVLSHFALSYWKAKKGIVFQLPELLDKLSAKWGRVAIRVAKDSSSRRATRWSSFLLSGHSTGVARSLSLLRRVFLFFSRGKDSEAPFNEDPGNSPEDGAGTRHKLVPLLRISRLNCSVAERQRNHFQFCVLPHVDSWRCNSLDDSSQATPNIEICSV